MDAVGYTIRIFVPDGDPEGVRVIDRMNWTGSVLAFPRDRWQQVRQRKEFDRVGVYVLAGRDDSDEDLPRVYIGEGDGLRERIEKHFKTKDFWDWGMCFSSNSNGLNKSHVQWLEYALVKRAREAKQCILDNVKDPEKPTLSEHEEADVEAFLREMLPIVPLVGLRVFEKPRVIVAVTGDSAAKPLLLTKGPRTPSSFRPSRTASTGSSSVRMPGTLFGSRAPCSTASSTLQHIELLRSPQ